MSALLPPPSSQMFSLLLLVCLVLTLAGLLFVVIPTTSMAVVVVLPVDGCVVPLLLVFSIFVGRQLAPPIALVFLFSVAWAVLVSPASCLFLRRFLSLRVGLGSLLSLLPLLVALGFPPLSPSLLVVPASPLVVQVSLLMSLPVTVADVALELAGAVV